MKELSVEVEVRDQKDVVFTGKGASDLYANKMGVKLTASKYKFCNLHISKCHSKANYHQKKLDKMFQDWQTPEALEEFLNRMKMPNAISWP